MKLEWDEAKNRANVHKHGLDFADAEEMFRGVLVVHPDTREDYGGRSLDRAWDDRWTAGFGHFCRPQSRHDSYHLLEEGRS